MGRRESHWGVVVDNRDPQRRGRLIIQCDTIAEGDVLEWVEPTFHFVDSGSDNKAGSFWVPNARAVVEVEIEAEPDSEATGLDPKWRCCVYPDGSVPETFTTNYPQRRGWVTRAGHIFYFDDTDGERVFHYEHPTGAKIDINNDGEILLETTHPIKVVSPDVRLGTANPTERGVLGDSFMEGFDAYLLDDVVFFAAVVASGLPGISTAAADRQAAAETLQATLDSYLALRVKLA